MLTAIKEKALWVGILVTEANPQFHFCVKTLTELTEPCDFLLLL